MMRYQTHHLPQSRLTITPMMWFFPLKLDQNTYICVLKKDNSYWIRKVELFFLQSVNREYLSVQPNTNCIISIWISHHYDFMYNVMSTIFLLTLLLWTFWEIVIFCNPSLVVCKRFWKFTKCNGRHSPSGIQ
jgi:hypothetical protein